jgi:hypothetical protein
MLAREDNPFVGPIVGTGLRVVEEGVIPSVMVWDDALPRLELLAILVGETTVPALVSVQETTQSTPMTGGPFSSFW